MQKIEKLNKIMNSKYFVPLIYFILVWPLFDKVLLHPDWLVFGTDTIDAFTINRNIKDFIFNYGQYPLWIPTVFSGMPHIDATSSIHLNIFCILFYILPLSFAFNIFSIIHIFLAGYCTYLFVLELGSRKSSAFIAGLTFMFTGTLISFIYVGHLAKIVSWAYLPLMLFLLTKAIDSRKPVYFLWTGLVMGHQFLGGHMQMSYYSTLFVFSFACFKIISNRHSKEGIKDWLLKPGGYFSLTIVIAVLMYTIQLAPGYFYAQKYSERSGGTTYEYSTSWSLAPEELLGTFIKDPFGWSRPFIHDMSKHMEIVEIDGKWPFPDDFTYYWGPMPQRQTGDYFGVLPFILAAIGIIFRRNKYTWFFIGAAILTLLLSMGKHTPVFLFAYKFIFGFSFFRVPLSIFALTVFSLSVLVGKGMDFLLDEIEDKKKKRGAKDKFRKKSFKKFLLAMTVFTVIVSFITIIFHFWGENLIYLFQSEYDRYRFSMASSQYSDLLNNRLANIQKGLVTLMIYLIISTILLYSFSKKKITGTLVVLFSVAIILSDLWSYGSPFIKYFKVNENTLYGGTEFVQQIKKEKEKFRVLTLSDRNISGGLVHARAFVYHGIEMVDGRHDLVPIFYQQFYSAAMNRPKLLNLVNTKYIAVSNKTNLRNFFRKAPNIEKQFVPYMSNEYFKVYKNNNYLPRAFIVNKVRVIKDPRYVLPYMMRNDFDPSSEAVLEEVPAKFDGVSGPAVKVESVVVEKYTPNMVQMHVEKSRDGLLVFADTYYPAWKVYVDGKEGKIYKTNYAFRGVYLPKGSHDVRFVYDSKILNVSAMISLVTLVLVFGGIIFIYWRERRNDPLVRRKA